MEDKKHTPGPWLNDGFAEGYHYISRLTENDSTGIALVCKPIHNRPQLTKAQAEANANLIAAAPDLLEALQGMIDVLVVESRAEQNALQKAFRAITKATGA